MCGIAGLLSTEQDLLSNSAVDTVKAMKRALFHRGPDGQGLYLAESGSASLCHTRLSIIDLSTAGQQPMLSQNGRYAITFNGEIYNFQELRKSLESRGVSFNSNSDTEVLLSLFEHEGPSCVKKLRGMFSFVIWDEENQQAFAARDPLGIKPFYYVSNTNKFAFSSELRSLLSAKLHSNSLCPNGISSFFRTGTVTEPYTTVKGVTLLPAGTTLTWKNGQFSTHKYWSLPNTGPSTPADDIDNKLDIKTSEKQSAIRKTRLALESTVKAHFVSDVPVGIFLSGGIDSTALVALATKVTDATINTYSIAFESPEWNEGDIARKVAEHFGTNHTEFLLTPEIAKPLFHEFLAAIDQPTVDGFNTFCVSRLAKEAGEKVVLSGVGADELFAGYKSFKLLPKLKNLSRRSGFLFFLFVLVNKTLSRFLPAKIQRACDFLSKPNSLKAAYQSLRGIFSTQETKALCKKMGLTNIAAANAHVKQSSNLSTVEQVSHLELTHYMRNQLLRDSDVMSMANGLELRVPFVDRELIESLATIAPEIRLNFGKTLLIDAVPELPSWVITRPKQGFRFPFDEWFSSHWSTLTLHQAVPKWVTLTPWYRRWSLLVLQDWQQRHFTHPEGQKG